MKNIEEFLAYYHSGDSRIFKQTYYYDENNKLHTPYFEIKSSSIIYENTVKGCDICFTPNYFDDKRRLRENISKLYALFIDCDAGSINNVYLSKEDVDNYKAKKLEEILSFPLVPTFVIETRNGFQVHWLFDTPLDKSYIEEWQNVQNKLIAIFDSDPKVKDTTRLMRMPFTYWRKDWKRGSIPPYYCNIQFFKDIRHNLEYCGQIVDKYVDKHHINYPLGTYNLNRYFNNNTFIDCSPQKGSYPQVISKLNIEEIRSRLKPELKMFYTEKEAKNYILKNIDIGTFLGIDNPKHFNCIFHNDMCPSAFITAPEENYIGYYLYTCMSSNCSFETGTIFTVVERLNNISFLEAKEFIKDAMNIVVEKTAYKRKQLEIIDEDDRIIFNDELAVLCPKAYNLLLKYNCISIMYYIFSAARNNLHKPYRISEKNEVIFSISQRHLAKQYRIADIKRLNKRIAILTYFGLINKVPDSDIPIGTLQKAKEYQKKNNLPESIQFYSLDLYDSNWMQVLNKRIELWINSNCTMKGMSKELIYRTFGQEEADRVYPKLSGGKPTLASENFLKKLSMLILEHINKKGYTYDKEILPLLKGKGYILEVKEKRVLPQILSQDNLEYRYLNKNLKEKYNIPLNYGSKIIVRNNLS